MGKRGTDLTGERFSSLVVVGHARSEGKHPHVMWLCDCDYGQQKAIASDKLKSGKSQDKGECDRRC